MKAILIPFLCSSEVPGIERLNVYWADVELDFGVCREAMDIAEGRKNKHPHAGWLDQEIGI